MVFQNFALLPWRNHGWHITLHMHPRGFRTEPLPGSGGMFELGFDLSRVESGIGTAPLPPVAADDMAGIGRTNDAILYGGKVTLWVRADDELLAQIGPKVPSSASSDHGAPFAEVFARYNGDFYKIDPLLFSPAEVEFRNLKTGTCHRFGKVEPALVRKSFGLA